MEILIVVLGAAVIGLVAGGILARVVALRTLFIVALVLFGLAGVLLFLGSQLVGFDGIGYTITAMLVVTPVAAAIGLIGLIVWFGGRR